MTRSSSPHSILNAQQRKEYERLACKLEALPLLAQGSVFAIEPAPDAPRARTRYVWTRKVKAKTVTKALTADQYARLKQALEANRTVEEALKRMREISQEAIVKATPKPGKK